MSSACGWDRGCGEFLTAPPRLQSWLEGGSGSSELRGARTPAHSYSRNLQRGRGFAVPETAVGVSRHVSTVQHRLILHDTTSGAAGRWGMPSPKQQLMAAETSWQRTPLPLTSVARMRVEKPATLVDQITAVSVRVHESRRRGGTWKRVPRSPRLSSGHEPVVRRSAAVVPKPATIRCTGRDHGRDGDTQRNPLLLGG
jgi:hypothetical protein